MTERIFFLIFYPFYLSEYNNTVIGAKSQTSKLSEKKTQNMLTYFSGRKKWLGKRYHSLPTHILTGLSGGSV